MNEMINIYLSDLKGSLWVSIESLLPIKEEIDITKWDKDHYDAIINIPIFYKEKHVDIGIGEIRKQIQENAHKSFLLYIYNNGYDDGGSSGDNIKESEVTLKNIVENNKIENMDTIIISNNYQEKPSLSRIRSDMFDALVLSNISKNMRDNSIYLPLDADLRKIEEGYIREVMQEHDAGFKIVIGDRNWSSENEKDIDPRLYLEEKMFLLWEDYIYNRSNDQEISTITNGRSSSFDIKSLLLVKWYERNFSAADDLIIGHKLNWFYGQTKKQKEIASFIDKKIWSDWSRWSEAIYRGDRLFQQRDPWKFTIKENRENKAHMYDQKNKIIRSLIEWSLITDQEKNGLEGLYSSYLEYFRGKNSDLNLSYRKWLLLLLQEFFGPDCRYNFSFSEKKQKIEMHNI